MLKKLNLEYIIQSIISLIISLSLAKVLMDGSINRFVHPKFNWMLWLSAVIFLLISAISLLGVKKPRHMVRIHRYVFFVFAFSVIVAAFNGGIGQVYSNENLLSSTTVLDSDSNNLNSNAIKDISKLKNSGVSKEAGDSFLSDSTNSEEKVSNLKKGTTVMIDDQMYLRWYTGIYYDADKYQGVKFKMLARIFKDDNMKNYVILGRLGMLCCMADLQSSGFIYNETQMNNLKDGEWYYVTGEVIQNDKISYNHEFLPQMKNVEFERANKPADEFVYLY